MLSQKLTKFYRFLFFISTIMMLLPPTGLNASTAKTEGTRWLIAVGICKFADTRIPALTYCVADAKTVTNYFIEDNIPKEQIILLTNEDATRNKITNSLQYVADHIAEKDSLFFFYSSHGAGDNSGTTYFITFDTVSDRLAASALPMQELNQQIKEIKCQNIVLMIDTCHSGGVKSLGKQDEKALAKLVRSANKLTRVAILTSSRTHESSIESKKWQHGAFTYFMIDGLSGPADNFPHDGKVSVTELFDYVMVAVPRATNRAQHPSAKFSYNWPGEKDQAVKIGETSPQNNSNLSSTTGSANSYNSNSESIIDNYSWRGSNSGRKNQTEKKPRKWQNVIK